MTAVASSPTEMWWLTLALGGVVVAAVSWLLLSVAGGVREIEAAMERAVREADEVADLTRSVGMLRETVELAGGLCDEARQQAVLLVAAVEAGAP